jgi:hypothetical protein
MKTITGKLSLWVIKLEGESSATFPCLRDSVEENSVETSDTGIDQCIKDRFVNLQSKFSTYFPEALNDKYERITDQLHAH